MKITDRAKAEFEFYVSSPLDMIGHEIGVSGDSDPAGYSALECWYSRDTHGKRLPCREPELLAKVTRSKQSVNLQVKLWAEDVAAGLLTNNELKQYTNGWPEWVHEAVVRQAGSLCVADVGFVPRFVSGKVPVETAHAKPFEYPNGIITVQPEQRCQEQQEWDARMQCPSCKAALIPEALGCWKCNAESY